MQPKAVDVAIIGGGIMGCAAALHLRQRGRSVVLLDRGAVGAQASGVNFGNVRCQGRFLPQLPLALRARTIWDELTRFCGQRCEYAVVGNLLLAFDEQQMAEAEEYAVSAREWGLPLDLLSRSAVRSRWPWLADNVYGASFCAGDGAANPRLVTPAIARTAVALGAEIIENADVREVAWNGSRFSVSTSTGSEIRAECLINTAGAWSDAICTAFGEAVPLVASGPQLGVTEPLPYTIEPTVSVVGHSIYFRQIERGNVIFGGGLRGPACAKVMRAYVMPEITQGQIMKVADIVPLLAPYRLIRVWSGIEGYLPDKLPVIGASARVPGLFHAFGFCGHGFQLGPAVGAVLSELVVYGRTTTPIECFSIRRFVSEARAASC